ncbi:UNVERIFIED_CONTAM: ATP-dependent DNA helicaseRECG, chloroplastic [Sesamum radiatum]|uniref:ATP-dependent DNA helicaseRECG, chloroplastic n=1 Tax=Sesamum radiatum TaxID=300843 RepID=A0AAW2V5B7_SESRA
MMPLLMSRLEICRAAGRKPAALSDAVILFMAVTTLAVHVCSMGFSEKCLRHAVNFEAERAYRNIFGRRLRFCNFLSPNILSSGFRSKHKFPEKFLKGVDGYEKVSVSEQSKMLDKESVFMGYSGLDELIGSSRSREKFIENLKGENFEFDAALACKQFPSITLGCFPTVELYDGPACYSQITESLVPQILGGSIPSHIDANWVDTKCLYQNLQSLYSEMPNMNAPYILEEKVDDCFIHSQSPDQKMETRNALQLTADKPCTNAGSVIQQTATSVAEILDKHINCLPGLTKRQFSQLENCGFHTLRKLLHHFPRTYVDLQNAEMEIDDGQYLIFVGKIMSSRGIRASSSFSFLEVVVACEVADADPNPECTPNKLEERQKRTIFAFEEVFPWYPLRMLTFSKKYSGKAQGGRYCLCQWEVFLAFLFVQYSTSGVIYARALKTLPVELDPLPKDVTRDLCLPSLSDAYIGIHQPANLNEADLARRRLIFDEFFYLQLGRLFQMLEGLGTKVEKDGLLKSVPLLTPEIPLPIFKGTDPTLKGDVGCGKTVVAFLACMEVIGSGYQAAFMVPTELLAFQHYEHLLGLLEKIEEANEKPSVALLTGSTPSKQAQLIRKGLQTGDISMVIGTHTLIAEKVEFSALRIAVVDEQHRFGVVQRGRFNSKLYFNSITSQLVSTSSNNSAKNDVSMAPHVLAMSATPIPRSLALALYGDMSLTQITDLPPGRTPVKTYVIEGNEAGFERAYQMMLEDLEAGGKVYLVYPVIEQSEQLPQLRAASADLETISTKFSGYKCGLLHGRMRSDEKEEALRMFRSGETNILLATQVIEIGVDIPDASMMVVMNAERFGMAQLHQLRGRVGRGERKSKCILLASSSSSLKRLKVLEKSSDGFYLANMDLVLRGPGDLLGKKQSGHLPEFPVARLEVDGNILQDAHHAALKVLETSHDLEKFPDLKAELSMRQPLCPLGD